MPAGRPVFPRPAYGTGQPPGSGTSARTMARFWFMSDLARRRVIAALEKVPQGRIMPDAELKQLRAHIEDGRFGELIFLVRDAMDGMAGDAKAETRSHVTQLALIVLWVASAVAMGLLGACASARAGGGDGREE